MRRLNFQRDRISNFGKSQMSHTFLKDYLVIIVLTVFFIHGLFNHSIFYGFALGIPVFLI